MIYPIDRIQYSAKQGEFYLFEFIMVDDIYDLNFKLDNSNDFWLDLKKSIDIVHRKKLEFLAQLNSIKKSIVIYQKAIDDLIIVLSLAHRRFIPLKYNFDELSDYFRKINGIDGIAPSKGLGSVRSNNEDSFVNSILRDLYKLNAEYTDDCGLEITKRLLKGDETKGFDIDLFQYIPSTGEYILYEFLKNETDFISNIKAHPMRYCWNNSIRDNRKKFISLWKAKTYFGGKLYLVNYSDNKDEKISISEVVELNEDIGFVEENKYCMSHNVFRAWLKDMQNYNKKHNNYLGDFKGENYDRDFFVNWAANKRDYGNGFYE